MALGYEIGTIMKRNSIIHSDDRLTIKLDTIEGMGAGFVQVLLFLLLTACAVHIAHRFAIWLPDMVSRTGGDQSLLGCTCTALPGLQCST